MKNFLWIIIAIIVFGGYTWFGKIQDDVISYNDMVIDLLEEEEKIFTDYVDFLEKYYANETINMEEMNTTLATLLSNHGSVSSRVKQIKVPDYDVCRAFHARVLDFLDNDYRIINTYADINNHVEANNPGTEADIDKISAMLEPLLVQNDSIFNEIIIAQKSMSDKFRFKLE